MSTLTIPGARRSAGAHNTSATQAVASNIRALISGDFKVEIQETLGDRFIEYVHVENGEFNLDNTAWYVERLCYKVKLSGDILHVGCGFGVNPLVVAECAGRVRSIRGIDPDAGKIAVFHNLIARLGSACVSADLGVGEHLPYDAHAFDCVICNESISHVESIPRVLAEIRRTLRPGGRVIISDTAGWNPYSLWFKYGRRHLDENYQSKRRMRRYLTEGGFRGIIRVPGMVAPRNPWRGHADGLWWLQRWIDPKYVLTGMVV